MNKNSKIKLASMLGCIFGIICAFSTGMFVSAGKLFSIPTLLMVGSTFLFLISVILYILWSKD